MYREAFNYSLNPFAKRVSNNFGLPRELEIEVDDPADDFKHFLNVCNVPFAGWQFRSNILQNSGNRSTLSNGSSLHCETNAGP